MDYAKRCFPKCGTLGITLEKVRNIQLKEWQKYIFPALVIVIVWGLVLLPIIFYHLPNNRENENETGRSDTVNRSMSFTSGSGSTDNGSGGGECLTKYTGMQCLEYLQSCSSNEESSLDIFISSYINDQSAIEEMFATIMFGLDTLVQPSKECRKRLVPFLCLHYFGLCKDGIDYGPNVADCLDIRDDVCKSEWQEGNNLLQSRGLPPLPDCSIFNDNGLVCITNNATQSCTIDCHDQFYCENNMCKPRCDNFREYCYEYTVAADVLVGTACSIGVLCGITIFVVACLRPKRMLAFPTVLIIYMVIALLVLDFVILLTILNRPALYCRSNDLVTSLQHPTTYCKISGFLLSYSTMQFPLLWIMHISSIFWNIHFPMNTISLKSIRRTKYIHGICLIASLLLPLISPLASHLKGGFIMIDFPSFTCDGRDADVTFYVHILPITIILGVGTSLLVLIFWRLHMQRSPRIGTAERKVLLVFLYYILVGVLILTVFTLLTRTADEKYTATVEYLQCEANGRNNTCEYDPPHYPALSLVINVLLGLFPAIILVFVVNVSEVRAVSKHTIKKLSKVFSSISSTVETDVSAAV